MIKGDEHCWGCYMRSSQKYRFSIFWIFEWFWQKRWTLQLLLWRNWGWLTGVGSRDARQALLFCFLKYSTLKDISTEEYWIEIFSHSEIIAFRRLKDDAVIQQKNNFLNTKTCNGNEIRSSKEINLMGWSCLEDRKILVFEGLTFGKFGEM